MKMFSVLAWVGIAACVSIPAKATTLLNSTIDADIELSGSDDNGSYLIDIFTGPISVGSGFSGTYSFFRRDTFDTFSGPTDQLTGQIGLNISANTIALTFSGQAQPVELIGDFTNIPASVQSVSEADAGFISGVNEPLPLAFAPTSLSVTAFYFGFQPGTNTTQTDLITFGSAPPGVPEPATWAVLLFGLFGLGAMARAKRSWQDGLAR